MQIRKVQITGGKSFYITLPIDWVKFHHIKRYQELGVYPSLKGNLLISPLITDEEQDQPYDVKIDANTNPDYLFRSLLAAYLMGSSKYKVHANSSLPSNIRDSVTNFVNSAFGLEIVEERPKYIMISNLIQPGAISFTSAIQRMETLVSSMHEAAIFALKTKNLSLTSDVIKRDNEINHYHWLISRMTNVVLNDFKIAVKMAIKVEDVSNFTIISLYLEQIGDTTVHLAQNANIIIQEDFQLPKKVLGLIATMSKMALFIVSESINCFNNKDILGANQMIEKMQDISEYYKNALLHIEENDAIPKKFSLSLAIIFHSLERIAHLGASIAEMVINTYTLEKIDTNKKKKKKQEK